MKILVCISHVPDTTSKINFVNGDSEFDTNGVQYVINPNDEYGLTRAIWFQEQQGATVTVVNVGGATAADVLQLIKDVQTKIKAGVGVELQPEVLVIGEE